MFGLWGCEARGPGLAGGGIGAWSGSGAVALCLRDGKCEGESKCEGERAPGRSPLLPDGLCDGGWAPRPPRAGGGEPDCPLGIERNKNGKQPIDLLTKKAC